MSTSANLDSTSVSIDPGGEAVVPLQIRNDSGIVEAYRLEVVGLPAQWTVVEPEAVSLYPGNATTARVLFRPPRSAQIPAGEIPFGVRVVPTENPHQTVVPEGIVQVLPFTDTSAEIIPRNSRGRLSGKHRVAIDNRGNVPLPVMLTGTDPNDALAFSLKPESANVGPGHADFANLAVRPLKRLWTGQPITHPFQVAVAPTGGAPVVLDATYVQEPRIPRWLGRFLLLLLAVSVALVALWFAVLRPTIQSAAKDAVKESNEQAQASAAKAEDAAKQASTQADVAKKQADAAAAKAGGASDAVAKKQAADQAAAAAEAAQATIDQSFTKRLSVSVAANKSKTASFTVPAKQTLLLGDLLLQNPNGDSGVMFIKQNNDVLWQFSLENFRTDDQHVQTPIEFKAGDKLVMEVTCLTVGKVPPGEPNACNTAVTFTGNMQVPKPKPSPSPKP